MPTVPNATLYRSYADLAAAQAEGEDNRVRVVDVFVDELNLEELGFEEARSAATGRPSYYPAVLLKIYIDGYLNQVQSSRRLPCSFETEREPTPRGYR